MCVRIIVFAMMIAPAAVAQTFTEKISKELAFKKNSPENVLMVANMFGNVNVEGYEGDKILLEVVRTVHARTDANLEKGKSEIQLGIIDRLDTLIVYVGDGCHAFEQNGSWKNNSGWSNSRWEYKSDGKNSCRLDYDYKMDFTLKVPASLHVLLSTINNGDIVVADMQGIVKTGNINGNIRMTNIGRESEARTINGDVDIDFVNNPVEDCKFYTLNGDINALFQQDLSANVGFESFNGNFYTNILKLETLPLPLEESSRGDGIRYRIRGNRYQAGKGGAKIDFETFNGNVYLREKIN